MTLPLLILALSGCLEPEPSVDTQDTDVDTDVEVEIELLQGQLTSGDVVLHWRWRDAWETGACVEFELENLGPALEAWRMTIGVDQPIDTESRPRSYHALVVFRGNRIDVASPYGTQLEPGDKYLFEYCADPQTVPEQIVDIELIEEIPEDPEDPYYYGSLIDIDGVLAIEYQQGGEINGGECLFLTVLNLSGRTLAGWEADLNFRNEFELTASAGEIFPRHNTPTTLRLVPEGVGAANLQPFDVATGEVCMNPVQEPTNLLAEVTYAPDPE